MSITTPIKKGYSIYQIQESSNLLKMSEHLTDSNIMQSRKTYGRKKNDRSSSISSESSESFSATASEDFKNNVILSFTDCNKESYSEENFEFVKSITSNHSENSTIQNGTVVDSVFSLYTENDMLWLYSEKQKQHDSSSSVPEISNSGSNYQRTRKNQKNRLSNQQYGSEEISESTLHTDNFTSLTNTNESKSASNLPNRKQTPTKQNSVISIDSQLKHNKINGIKSSDACVNNLPQKPNLFQAGKTYGKGTVSQNPLNNTKFLPILDLVNRFTASRNQDNAKSNLNNKRKRIKEDSGSIPAKKIATNVKKGTASKINSVENKIPNSTVSVKKYSKSTVLKSDMTSTVSYLGTIKEGDVKTLSKATQKNSRSVDNTERSVDMIVNVNNPSVLRKVDFKTPSKSVQKKICRSVDNAEKSVDMIGNVNNLSALRNDDVKILSKSVQKQNSRSVDNAEKFVDMIGNVNNLSALRNGDVKILSKSIQKQNSRSVDNAEKNVDMIGSANNLNTLKKGLETPSKAVQKKNCRSVNNTEKSIEMLKKYVSKNDPVKNYATAKVNCPSTSADLHLVSSGTVEKIHSDYGDKQIEIPPFVQSKECMFQNQTLNNIPNANFGFNSHLNMPLIIAPMPPTSQDGAFQVTPLVVWRSVPSVTYNHSIQSDNNAVSYENFRDLSIPGPSTLSDDYSSMNGSDSNVKSLETSESIYLITDDTTTTTIINQSYLECNKQKRDFRPRTRLNDGIEFHRFVSDNLKSIEENCILHYKEQSSKTFLMNPALLNITVKDFYDNHSVTDALLDYLTGYDMGNSLAVRNNNKGYDFPENFETENLLRVVKDFVHTTISFIIPANSLKSLNFSYSIIMKRAMLKMSSREIVIMTRIFQRTEPFKLKDVLARLSLVALFVIFDEYRNKKWR